MRCTWQGIRARVHEVTGMHGFRFTYYERYEELMKEGRSESNARAEATAAAETAVKNAVLPYKARRPRQLEGWERCCALRCYREPYDSKRNPTRPFDTWRGSVRAPVPRDAEPCPTLLLEWLRDLVEMHALFSCVSRGHHGVVWVLGVLKYSAGSTTAVSRPRNAVGCMILSACGKGILYWAVGHTGHYSARPLCVRRSRLLYNSSRLLLPALPRPPWCKALHPHPNRSLRRPGRWQSDESLKHSSGQRARVDRYTLLFIDRAETRLRTSCAWSG